MRRHVKGGKGREEKRSRGVKKKFKKKRSEQRRRKAKG